MAACLVDLNVLRVVLPGGCVMADVPETVEGVVFRRRRTEPIGDLHFTRGAMLLAGKRASSGGETGRGVFDSIYRLLAKRRALNAERGEVCDG